MCVSVEFLFVPIKRLEGAVIYTLVGGHPFLSGLIHTGIDGDIKPQ